MSALTRAGRIRLIAVAILLLALEVACRAGWIDPVAVIAPSLMLKGAWQLLASGKYTNDILLTLSNVAIACSLAVVSGLPGLVTSGAYLRHVWIEANLLGLQVKQGTTLLFDLGVYLAVLGTVLAFLFGLSREAER